jgi:hypothetical protein
VLSELGLGLLHMILIGQTSCLFRTVVSEAARTPELGDLFYQRGPGLTVERLAAYLKRAAQRGELRCDDPPTAARLFLGAVVSHFHLRCLVQPGWQSPAENEIRRLFELSASFSPTASRKEISFIFIGRSKRSALFICRKSKPACFSQGFEAFRADRQILRCFQGRLSGFPSVILRLTLFHSNHSTVPMAAYVVCRT